MWFEIFSWAMVGLSLFGVVLNIRHNQGCWYVWAVSNCGWLTVGIGSGLYSLAFLQTIYLVLNYYGARSWARAHERTQAALSERARMLYTVTDPLTKKEYVISVTPTGGHLEIKIKGYGDYESEPNEGAVALLDIFDGEVKLCVYADINDPEPTHVIDLDGAREELRK